MTKATIQTIDAILPQTQCGLCSYGACQPYAKALVENNAPINLCPPGGVETLQKLGEILHQDPVPYLDEMREKTKSPTRAVIREDECIGCTKCIQVCPVDAIIGASKQMHAVLGDECTGCDLCLEPCPMDCIDMIPVAAEDTATIKLKANRARQRYNTRQERLQFLPENIPVLKPIENLDQRKLAISEAVARAKTKRENLSTQALQNRKESV